MRPRVNRNLTYYIVQIQGMQNAESGIYNMTASHKSNSLFQAMYLAMGEIRSQYPSEWNAPYKYRLSIYQVIGNDYYLLTLDTYDELRRG